MNESYDKCRGLGTLSPEDVEAVCDELLRVGEPRAAVQILQSLDLLPEPLRSESRRSLASMLQIIPRPIVSTKHDGAVEACMNGAENDVLIEADNFIADIFSEIRTLFDLTGTGGWIEPADCSEVDARSIVLCCELLPGTIEDLEVAVRDVRPLTLRNRLLSAFDAFAKVARTSAPYFPPREITGRVMRRHRGKDENQRLNERRQEETLQKKELLADVIRTVLGERATDHARSTTGLVKVEIDLVQRRVREALGPDASRYWPSASTVRNYAAPLVAEWSQCCEKSGT